MAIFISFISGVVGVLVGAFSQHLFQLRLIDLENKQKLYTELFHKLRDPNNTKIEIMDLICDAQLFASDDVLDILQKVDMEKKTDLKILHDLLVVMRKELRITNKKRPLEILSGISYK